jgi:hypothetical protein
MKGSLRDDLLSGLQEWEEQADLCLTLGASLSGIGMNADRVAISTANRRVWGRAGHRHGEPAAHSPRRPHVRPHFQQVRRAAPCLAAA